MVYSPTLQTPEGSPLRPEVVESSTPWSEVSIEELSTQFRFSPPPRLAGKYGYTTHHTRRTRLRNQSRVLWLVILLLVLLWWGLTGRGQGVQWREINEKHTAQPDLDGLQFIDAAHPYIRVRYPSISGFQELIR